jgi:hypothetical protein
VLARGRAPVRERARRGKRARGSAGLTTQATDTREGILEERARRAQAATRDIEPEDWAPQLYELVDRAEALGDADLARDLRFEIQAVFTARRIAGTSAHEARFHQVTPELTQPAALTHLHQLAQDPALPALVRAQLLDLVWSLERAPRAHGQSGREAAEAYLSFDAVVGATLPTLRDEDLGRGFKLIDALARASALARETNQRDTAQRASAAIQARCAQVDAAASYRYTLELTYGLLDLEQLAPGGLAAVVDILDRAYAHFVSEKNFHLAREVLHLQQESAKLRATPDAIDALKRKFAESFVAEANEKQASGGGELLVGHFLHQAVDAYGEVANGEREIAQLTARMDAENLRALGEMKPISARVEVPRAAIDQLLERICAGTQGDALDAIAIEFLLDRQRAYAGVAARAGKFVFQELVPVTVMTRYGKTVTYPSGTEARRDHEAFKDAAMTAGVLDHILREAFDRLRTTGLNPQTVVAHLRQSPFFAPNALTLIERGIERTFAGDFASGVHLLVPQVEAILREMLRAAGAPVVRVSGLVVDALLLDRLLRLARQYGVEDKIIFTLEVVLTAPGSGVRHAVAHGWLAANECTPELAHRIIQLLLALALIRPAAPPAAT